MPDDEETEAAEVRPLTLEDIHAGQKAALHARVENDFVNHPPVGDDVNQRMDDVTAQCLSFAHWIVDNVPAGREQSLALTNLELVSRDCKAGIARHQ